MAKNLINEILDVIELVCADAKNEHLKIDIKTDRKRYREYLEKLFIAKEKKETELSSKSRLKPDGVEITWKGEKLSFEKADRISFDDKKIYIEYENETTVISFKNIKKLKFPSLLTKKKEEWTWNSNLSYYDDTTTVSSPSWYLNFTTK